MRIIHAALAGVLLLPAACATSQTGKPILSASVAATDLTQDANIIALASAIYSTTPNPSATLLADLTTAQNAIRAAANGLNTSGATSGDLAANISLAVTATNSAIAAVQAVNPPAAAKLTGYLNALLAAIAIYNSDAAAAGLPQIPVPTGA